MKCQARQVSDQMRCEFCRLVWDMNDPDPPECGLTATKDLGDPQRLVGMHPALGASYGVHEEEEVRDHLSADAGEYRMSESIQGSIDNVIQDLYGGERDTRSEKGREIIAETADVLGLPTIPLRCYGVSRIADNEQTLAVAFNRVPSDAELQFIHDLLRHNMPKKPR